MLECFTPDCPIRDTCAPTPDCPDFKKGGSMIVFKCSNPDCTYNVEASCTAVEINVGPQGSCLTQEQKTGG